MKWLRNEKHEVFIEEIKKIALSSNDDKRIQSNDLPSYRILIVEGCGSRKTNAMLNLISSQPDTDQIYLYAKGPFEGKYQLLINKRESTGVKYFNNSEVFNTIRTKNEK